MPITIDGTNGITQAGEFNSDSSFGFKNRIINGAMVIDQRNAGASVTVTTDNTQFSVDRFILRTTGSSKYSAQQNAASVTPPVGFSNYLGITSLAATSLGVTDYYAVEQRIEAFNYADLNWGTSNAKTVTLSFWVRSSLTGTFGGNLRNSASDYCYPYSYTISAANTWEQKSVTIAGPTSGTWVASSNGTGIQVAFGLGVGSTYSGTAGSWASTFYGSATGATSVVGTNGATFYITGVQLEVGSTATSFDYRPYGTELQLCQRYYYKNLNAYSVYMDGYGTSSTQSAFVFTHPVYMRAAPTVTLSGTFSYGNASGLTVNTSSINGGSFYAANSGAGGRSYVIADANSGWTASIEL
jgi:hypothetical protein